MTTTLKALYDGLTVDRWRDSNPFSEESQIVNRVLFHPFAYDTEREESLKSWLQREQPCLFGRIAAAKGQLQYCFLTDRDLLESDEHVSQKILESRLLWKRRAFRGRPLHGFMLVVASQRLAFAAPDESLRQFSLRLQQLAGWSNAMDSEGNDIVSESLYLLNPGTQKTWQFTFSVDYFASAAEGRWWHDHRIPGGIAFTANSLGHMIMTQEWYEKRSTRIEWALRTAMLTIDTAAVTKDGRATWLMDVDINGPFKQYEWNEDVPLPDLEKLKGKDCGSYAGHLHTDHAVRAEFFKSPDAPLFASRPWAMDFSYIFDPTSPDHVPFVRGIEVTNEQVEQQLGTPNDWRFVNSEEAISSPELRLPHVAQEIQGALTLCQKWQLSPDEISAIEGH